MDNNGKTVINRVFVLPSGQNYLSIDGIDKLASATYIVKIKSKSIDAFEKLVVRKKQIDFKRLKKTGFRTCFFYLIPYWLACF